MKFRVLDHLKVPTQEPVWKLAPKLDPNPLEYALKKRLDFDSSNIFEI